MTNLTSELIDAGEGVHSGLLWVRTAADPTGVLAKS
jgi:hypothetical protein